MTVVLGKEMRMVESRARDRMVVAAADMLRRRGLNATSVRELAKHSGAPLGSTYHYFPGGKSQLATEAVRLVDGLVARKLAKDLSAGPVVALREFVDMWRKVVLDSDFRAGCPVLAVSVEDLPDTDDPRLAAAAAFDQWTGLLADSLRAHGAADAVATRTATLIVAALEGCVAICRAQRDTAAMDRTADALEEVVRGVIGHSGG
ncbi:MULTISPECIES: TetR/AcrR family transcriptional regulator [Nocardia]|uniref:TetR/AcrR family transcriptional regulator n=1 Tax=Nocardia TaxID=1817 RepID=UPI001E4025B8|nr:MULTISPECIES: TetR family transcriptional regulator [Nocardia]